MFQSLSCQDSENGVLVNCSLGMLGMLKLTCFHLGSCFFICKIFENDPKMQYRGEIQRALVLSYVLEPHGAPCNPQKLIYTRDVLLSKLGIFFESFKSLQKNGRNVWPSNPSNNRLESPAGFETFRNMLSPYLALVTVWLS